jgi:hypothetical protein
MSPLDSLRQRLLNAGSDACQLGLLRQMLASTEDPRVLRALAVAASELADYVADDMLGAVGDLKDRIFEKCECIGATLPPPQRPCASRNLRTTVSPQVQMIISPWITDEFGNLSREVYADPEGPTWRP